MKCFRRQFIIWFLVLLLVFTIANLFVQSYSLPKGVNWIGFPYTFAWWGSTVKEGFDIEALLKNIAIGIGASAVLAWICAAARCRGEDRKDPALNGSR